MKNFNVIIIGLAVIGAIAVFITQLGGDNTAPAPQNNVIADIPADAPPQGSIPLIAETPAAPENIMNTMPIEDIAPIDAQIPAQTTQDASEPEQMEIASWEDMLAEEADLQSQDVVIEDMAAEEPENLIEDMGENILLSEDTPQDVQPDVQEDIQPVLIEAQTVQPAPVEEPVSILEETPAAAPQNTAPPRTTPETTAATAKKDTKITELEAALEMRNSEIDTLGAKLSGINTKIDAQNRENSQKSARIEELEDMVSKLQAQLRVAQEAQSKADPVKTAKPAQTQIQAKTTAKSQKTTQIQPVAKNAQRVQWSLRAAQPGLAVIAPMGTNDLKSVTTGNYVDGLGQITAIENINNRWVVIGTQGRLSQ